MKKLAVIALLCAFAIPALAIQRSDRSLGKRILGKWSYKSGKYEYYDSGNRKLKESQITAIQSLDIEVASKTAKVIYPDKKEFRSSYSIIQEKGKSYIVVTLPEKTIRYQILEISNNRLTVQARHNVTFYVDGDANKKVAYGLVIINLQRK